MEKSSSMENYRERLSQAKVLGLVALVMFLVWFAGGAYVVATDAAASAAAAAEASAAQAEASAEQLELAPEQEKKLEK